ncbi:MAG: class I SAM-dependent rRNA methyltransferase [Cyclobacteriaceae bacterium]|nr:class I SAM-dependent rRNA methyltransferase [Cyclobacteriaceae bacterium]
MTISGIITLKQGRDHSVKRFHPWVFSGAIQTATDSLVDGDWVEVKDSKMRTLGFGHFQKGTISVRMILFGDAPPSGLIFQKKIKKALAVRLESNLISEYTNAFRLVHGEGDGLPGLIIDLYHDVAIVQAHSVGMLKNRTLVAEAIKEVLAEANLPVTAVYYKSLTEKTESEYLLGMAAVPHVVLEHGNKFYVDWEEGQKTGFFLDQRENRNMLGEMAKGKSVLNTFCYTGGFSVYALQNEAELVHSVDASEKAIALTRKNLILNGYDPNVHECVASDTFDFLKDKKEVYDLIILDPPAFAKHKDARHQAVKGYQRLNAEAMKMIRPGGIIFTFSCSQVVDRQLFYDTIVSAGIQAGRQIKILHHLAQPADHPVSLYHPEGEYLKGLVLYVE